MDDPKNGLPGGEPREQPGATPASETPPPISAEAGPDAGDPAPSIWSKRALVAPPTGHEYLAPAFMAALCAGVLTGVPVLNLACCLWMIGGGALAVFFFRQMHGRPLTRLADGARIGTITGFFAFFIAFFVNLLAQFLINRGFDGFLARFREAMQKSMESMPDDPQSREAMAWVLTPGGAAFVALFGATMMFVAFVLCSTAGGAMAVRMRRED